MEVQNQVVLLTVEQVEVQEHGNVAMKVNKQLVVGGYLHVMLAVDKALDLDPE